MVLYAGRGGVVISISPLLFDMWEVGTLFLTLMIMLPFSVTQGGQTSHGNFLSRQITIQLTRSLNDRYNIFFFNLDISLDIQEVTKISLFCLKLPNQVYNLPIYLKVRQRKYIYISLLTIHYMFKLLYIHKMNIPKIGKKFNHSRKTLRCWKRHPSSTENTVKFKLFISFNCLIQRLIRLLVICKMLTRLSKSVRTAVTLIRYYSIPLYTISSLNAFRETCCR